MSLSQLSGKQGINYAKLRHKKAPNDQQSFGLELNRDNLNYIESLIQKRKPSVDLKHQRAKSTLESNKQYSYRNVNATQDLEELEGEKLFDQFFKLNNSKSESDFIVKPAENDFMRFLETSIEYHTRQEHKNFFKPQQKNPMDQKLKEATISNRLLANELNKYKHREQEMRQKMKLLQKEFQIQYTEQVQKGQWLEELLAKQKIDNENSLLAIKKTVEMLSTKCKCKNIQGLQLYDKILKDVKNQRVVQTRRYDDFYEDSKQTHSSSQLSDDTQEDELVDFGNFKFPQAHFFDKRKRKSITKTSEEQQQEQLVQSFIHGNSKQFKNPREYQNNDFLRKRPLKDQYYIEEENTINST